MRRIVAGTVPGPGRRTKHFKPLGPGPAKASAIVVADLRRGHGTIRRLAVLIPCLITLFVGSVDLDDVRSVLSNHRPRTFPGTGMLSKAAVAAVFSEAPDLQLLFIRRAENPKDRWSGHMAFPGGRMDPDDHSPLAAAHRETREEIDLDLSQHGRLIGELSHVPAKPRHRLPLVVVPYVFALEDVPPLTPDESEVAEAIWVPMSFLMDPTNRETLVWRMGALSKTLPCYRWQGREIWGMTLSMVDEVLRLIGVDI